MAVSHSWSQSFGSCLVAINGRANIIPWSTIGDLNKIRRAVSHAGYSLAWMDKICLRQRGVDGFDSALRHIEWVFDIPFLDVVYKLADKVIIYLDGAGRPFAIPVHVSGQDLMAIKKVDRAGNSWTCRAGSCIRRNLFDW